MHKIVKDMAPITCWPHMTIDTDAIAKGMLELAENLPEEYRTALTFGMLPAPLMELLNKILTEKIKTECCKLNGMPETTEYLDLFELPKNKFNEILRTIAVKMLQDRKHSIS